MNLSSLVVPVLLAAVAVYGAGKRVDVYGALTHGAEEGLTVLLRIIPALVGLLTAVGMFRASGAMGVAFKPVCPRAQLAGRPSRDDAPDAHSPCLRQRRPGSGHRSYDLLRAGQLCGAGGCRDAGQHGDDLLYHCHLFRLRRHPPHPPYHSRRHYSRSLPALSPPPSPCGFFSGA